MITRNCDGCGRKVNEFAGGGHYNYPAGFQELCANCVARMEAGLKLIAGKVEKYETALKKALGLSLKDKNKPDYPEQPEANLVDNAIEA